MVRPFHYNMSFTAGGLFLQESSEIARLFRSLNDWEAVRNKALEQNLIQSRTTASKIRVCREICQRLEELNDPELEILTDGTMEEQRQILWVAICRHHRFIHDFAVEVIREKYLQFNFELHPEDYDAFFNTKAMTHDELDKLTESTRNKLRQVAFRMLREAGLLTKLNAINPPMLSYRVAQAIGDKALDDLKVFPLSDKDIEGLLK